MNPLALWWLIFRGVERSFGAAHPLPQLPASQQPHYITVQESKRARHMEIVGNPGSGKTRLLEYIAMQEVGRRLEGKSERGIIVFDVHGDLYRNLRSRLAVLSLKYPQLYDWVVPIDPLNFFDLTRPAVWMATIDLLTPLKTQTPHDRAEMLRDAVLTAWQDEPTTVVRASQALKYGFLLLIRHPRLTLKDFIKLLRDAEFRNQMVGETNDPDLMGFWFEEYRQYSPSDAHSMLESARNRIDPLVSSRLSSVFSGQGTVRMRELLDGGAIVLIHAPVGILGKEQAYLLCSLLMAELQAAALSRVDIPDEELRRPALVIADEYLAYTTDSLIEIITQSRKFRIELLLGSQEVISGGGKS